MFQRLTEEYGQGRDESAGGVIGLGFAPRSKAAAVKPNRLTWPKSIGPFRRRMICEKPCFLSCWRAGVAGVAVVSSKSPRRRLSHAGSYAFHFPIVFDGMRKSREAELQ